MAARPSERFLAFCLQALCIVALGASSGCAIGLEDEDEADAAWGGHPGRGEGSYINCTSSALTDTWIAINDGWTKKYGTLHTDGTELKLDSCIFAVTAPSEKSEKHLWCPVKIPGTEATDSTTKSQYWYVYSIRVSPESATTPTVELSKDRESFNFRLYQHTVLDTLSCTWGSSA